jgi:phosphoglycolate phosphatase-like HAD superfamily hydrolase
MHLRGVVFDFDATLVNLGNYVDWKKAHNLAMDAYISCGCSSTMVYEKGRKGLFSMLNLVRGENTRVFDEKVVKEIQMRAFYTIENCEAEGVYSCRLIHGCKEVLEWLSKQKIKIGIATSNSQQITKKVLKHNNIEKYFSSIVGRRPELRLKPYPDSILKCLEEMGITPSQSVMVGDSINDVKAAKAAKVYSVAIPSFFTDPNALIEAGVNEIVIELKNLPKVFSNLMKNT